MITEDSKRRVKRSFLQAPKTAKKLISIAQQKNSNDAHNIMQRLVQSPGKAGKGVTKANTNAVFLSEDGGTKLTMKMTTARPTVAGESHKPKNKTERIRAILFANDTDHFYATWVSGKKRWRRRIKSAVRKTAKEFNGG